MRNTVSKFVATALALMLWTGTVGAADAPPNGPPAKPAVDRKVLLERLKARAVEWLNARKGLLIQCPTCGGDGVTRAVIGARMVARQCSSCDGAGRRYSKELGRKVLYDLRSPAWRLRESARDDAGREFGAWKLTDAWKIAPKSWRWDRAELVDGTHGIAYAFEGDDSVARPSYWTLVAEGGRAPTWFLWMEESDGPWPASPDEAMPEDGPAGPAAGGEAALEELPKLQGLTLGSLLDRVAATYRPKTRGRAGRLLVLELEAADVPVERTMRATIATDSIAYARGIFPDMKSDWDSMRLVFLGRWQDRFGERKSMPILTVTLAAETFARIRWDNLELEDAFGLFTAKESTYEGWTLLVR